MRELLTNMATQRSYGVTIVRTFAPTSTEEVVEERARGGGAGGAHRLNLYLQQGLLAVFGSANYLAGDVCRVRAWNRIDTRS